MAGNGDCGGIGDGRVGRAWGFYAGGSVSRETSDALRGFPEKTASCAGVAAPATPGLCIAPRNRGTSGGNGVKSDFDSQWDLTLVLHAAATAAQAPAPGGSCRAQTVPLQGETGGIARADRPWARVVYASASHRHYVGAAAVRVGRAPVGRRRPLRVARPWTACFTGRGRAGPRRRAFATPGRPPNPDRRRWHHPKTLTAAAGTTDADRSPPPAVGVEHFRSTAPETLAKHQLPTGHDRAIPARRRTMFHVKPEPARTSALFDRDRLPYHSPLGGTAPPRSGARRNPI